jgi:hypothetical protein
MNGDQPAFSVGNAIATSETTKGGASCPPSEIMGHTTNATNYGTAAYPLKTQMIVDGPFAIRPMVELPADCSDMHDNPSSGAFTTADSRN